MNKKDRLVSLLKNGYFPKELPPVFVTKDFASKAVNYVDKWGPLEGKRLKWSAPEIHTIPQYDRSRRSLSIVNPINQLVVSSVIAENWIGIRNLLKNSKTSEFKPVIQDMDGYRAIPGVDFDKVDRRKAQILAQYGRYLKTDINRFYSSIYTHSIPWAILGKSKVKKEMHTPPIKAHYSSKLDKAVSSGQEGQTIGIPIGPDTSRIIAEIISVSMEKEIANKVDNYKRRTVRYVDDYIVGFSSAEGEKAILSRISSSFSEYQLELNGRKTFIVGIGHEFEPDWLNKIQTFKISNSSNGQIRDLDNYFALAMKLSAEFTSGNVMLYAVKRASSFKIDDSNLPHLFQMLVFSARYSPDCIRFLVEFSISNKSKISSSEVRTIILDMLQEAALAAHHNEISWLLYWAREVGCKIPKRTQKVIIDLESSVCMLLLMDLKERKLVGGKIDLSYWKDRANANGLRSDAWLGVYELYRNNWWGNATVTKEAFEEHEHFKDILADGVAFYNKEIEAPGPASLSVLSSESRIERFRRHLAEKRDRIYG